MSAPLAPSRIDVHIGELRLEGVAAGDRHRVGDAIVRELGRLLAEDASALQRSRDVAAVDGGAVDVAAGASPEDTGVRVARAIYRGLVR